ncbi:MAG: 2-phospho-L-lactate transferase [Deltaproteobacteria bacterium]|nr:2-phospho-L-lactate transferase [Deltaproteobacteria bacterium]
MSNARGQNGSADRGGDDACAVVVLAGGVGAARFLRGVVRAVPPEGVTAIVNTGDDRSFYGAHVSPDLDIVTYTLAGRIDPQRGFGLAGDRFDLVERLSALGHETWFRLGDADYANCLHRTLRLAEGAGLDEVSDELRRDMNLALRILPMSNDACPTFIELEDGSRTHFEEYLVRDGSPTDVAAVDLSTAEAASAAPGVLDAIADADAILVSPSNPVVSIGPILAVRGVREALAAARAPIVAVSPIVGGAPIKGPAHTLLRALGVDVSALGVAGFYSNWIDGFVFDRRDRALLGEIEGLGLAAVAVDTMMVDAGVSEQVARAALGIARGLR